MDFTFESHAFQVHHALAFGVEGALLIAHFAHWIGVNKRLGRNQHEGRTWTYQTREEIAAALPYYTADQVRRYVDHLVDKGVLMKGNFSEDSFKKTNWYAFGNEKLFTTGKSAQSQENKKQLTSGEFAQSMGKFAQSISDTEATDTEAMKEYEGAAPAAPSMAAAMPPRPLRVSALPRSKRGAGEEPRSGGESVRGSRPSVVTAEEEGTAVRGSEASGRPKRVRDRLAVPENAIERAPNVYTTPEQHEKLICSPATAETVARAYLRLSEWKEQSPRAKWKRNDYLSIVRWVLDALKEEDLRKSKFSNGGCYRKSRADPNASPEQRAIYDALCPA